MDQILNYFAGLGGYVAIDGQKILMGGVTVVGVVIFLMGILKNVGFIKNMKNKTIRKVVLSWASIVLTVGITVLSVWLNELKQEHFVVICIVNSISTILLYWLYENTAVRDLFALIGKHTVSKVFARKPKTEKEAKQLASEIRKDVESLLYPVNSESSVLHKYKDDDLKNL
jgi:hypothetical protein